MKIGFDIDGVLADFDAGFDALLHQLDSNLVKFPLKGSQHPPVWDWPQHYGASDQLVDRAWSVIKNTTDFWRKLPAFECANFVLGRANMLRALGHEVYYVTARLGAGAKAQTEDWLMANGAISPTVILAKDKGPVFSGLKLDAFIDDKPENLEVLPIRTKAFLVKRPFSDLWFDRTGRHRGVVRVADAAEMLVHVIGR
jgi:hypothetical protein